MKTQRSNKNRKLLHHLDNKFVETDKTKDLGLQVAKMKIARFDFIAFTALNPISLVIKILSILLVQERFHSYGRFISLFQEKK